MIAIISDVHGNFPALRAVLEAIDKLGCDKIISLGDVCGYYCMVNECIEEFRKRDIINILGNHEGYLLGKDSCTRSNTVEKITNYQKNIITPVNLEYLKTSKEYIDTDLFSARHGGWNDPRDEYIEYFDFKISNIYHAKIYCSGHTHVQKLQQENGTIYFNPGSVGQPRDYDNRAGFATINPIGKVSLYRIEYDIDQISYEMKKCGFENRIYACLYRGARIGE